MTVNYDGLRPDQRMRIWKRVTLALFLTVTLSAWAEENAETANAPVKVQLELDEAQRIVDESEDGWNLKRILQDTVSGQFFPEAEEIVESLRERLMELSKQILPDFAAALAPVLLLALITQLMPEKGSGGAKMARFACAAASALVLTRHFRWEAETVGGAIRRISSLMDALTPALTVMLTVTGGTRSASLITPMGALASRVISLAAANGALMLCAASVCIAVVDGMGGLGLKRLSAFIRSITRKLLVTAVSGFFALVSTGGLLSGAYDGATLKGAKLAVGTFIPIIGGELADTMESLASSASLLRSALGVTALTALLAVCITPLLSCVCSALIFRFGAAACEPIGDERILRMMDVFADAFSTLAAVVAASAALIFALIGATLGLAMRLYL